MQSNKHAIAVIDENSAHLARIRMALTSYYDIITHESAERAVEGLNNNPPRAIILTRSKTKNISDVKDTLKSAESLKNIPIIYISEGMNDKTLQAAIEAGIDATLTKPYARSALIKTISNLLNTNIEKEWESLPETQKFALKNTTKVFQDISDVLMNGETVRFESVKDSCQPLVTAIEENNFQGILDGVRNYDDYTYAHSMRVATFLSLLGHAANFKNDEQLLLASGGLMHDIGKMMIPHNILNKPGKLTDEEFEIMKSHVTETLLYLDQSPEIPKGVRIIAAQHHEKIDGTGYPNGLKGAELNELARMAAVVDVFSALTDRRVYKPEMPATRALKIMKDEMTTHLDQHYVKMFETILHDANIIK